LENLAFPRAALVIFVGGMLGAVPILHLGDGGFLRLGPALGVLVVSLITAAIHRTGPMVWSQSGRTTRLMAQIGLPLFLSQIGNESYVGLVQSWEKSGVLLVAFSIAPVVIITLLVIAAGKVFKHGALSALSFLPSVALNTPALDNLQDKYREKIPGHIYATVYPVVTLGLLCAMFALSLVMN
jgi:putative transport protein